MFFCCHQIKKKKLLDVQEDVVVSTLFDRSADLLPDVGLFVVVDETNHGCVFHQHHNIVVTEGRSEVVGQQREDQGAEHTALGDPRAQNGGSGCVAADPHSLRPLAREVWRPVAQACQVCQSAAEG